MDESLPLSALQHYLFCPRQFALIHIEQQWAENKLTAEGRLLHERSDQLNVETRKGIRTVTAMPLNAPQLGIHGIADVVEFAPTPYPVEYKRGKQKKAHRADEVQLCAQALCLEEMLNVDVFEGALFYAQARRRHLVAIDNELRTLTQDVIQAARECLRQQRTPGPLPNLTPCKKCSLIEQCQPHLLSSPRSAQHWFTDQLEQP